MIPKEWRDYKWEFRPVLILIWFLVSPAVVLPILWLSSLEWRWTEEIVWDRTTAPGWVSAVGSIAVIGAGFGVAYVQMRHQQTQVARQERLRKEEHHQAAYAYMAKALQASSFAVASIMQLRDEVTRAGLMFRTTRLRYFQRLFQNTNDDMALIAFSQIEDADVAVHWLAVKRDLVLATASVIDLIETHGSIHQAEVIAWANEIQKDWGNMSRAIQAYVYKHPYVNID